MARKKNPWETIGDAIGGAGDSAKNTGRGGGGGGSATGTASSGAASVAGGVGTATGTSTGYSAATGGVASVAGAVSSRTAPTPTYSPYQSRSTTTVNLKPLMSTITDPATRALAAPAISAGLKYEVNPSVLLAAASVTDYGRKGRGKGYTNLGDGSEDGAKSIKQAARYLSEAGFHTDPDKAIRRLAKVTGNDPEQIRKTASGYMALDDAARKIEVADGDTRVNGVGHFKFRKPEDRPSARAAREQRPMGGGHDAATTQEIKQRSRDQAAAQGLLTVDDLKGGQTRPSDVPPQAAAESRGKALNTQGTQLSKRGEQQMKKGNVALARATANAAEGSSALVRALGAEPGPKPRKVAKRLQKAVKKSAGTVPNYVPAEYRKLIADASSKTGVPAELLSALLRQESGFDPNISSPAGASGIAQFMPGTAASRGVDPLDPKSAIPGAAELLAESKAQFGSWELALAAYNAGPGAPGISEGKIPPYEETQNYVKTIMGAVGDTTATAKDVPKKLITRARKTLGDKATKALLQGGKLVKASKDGGGQKHKLQAEELFYDGADQYFDSGTWTAGQYGGHGDHVHFASQDPRSMLMVIKKAQQLGMLQGGTGENPAIDVIDSHSGTVEDSWHMGTMDLPKGRLTRQIGAQGEVLGQAVDIAGSPEQMDAMAAWISENIGKNVSTAPPEVPIKGTNLAVQLPPPPSSTTGTSSGGVPSSGGAPALTAAMDAVDKARRGAAAVGGTSPITSAAAAYARSSLNNDPTGDPIYEAFRPRR